MSCMEILNYGVVSGRRPISQIPKFIRQISNNVPFCYRNAHTCAYFCYKMVHRGIWNWCIVGLMRLVYNCYTFRIIRWFISIHVQRSPWPIAAILAIMSVAFVNTVYKIKMVAATTTADSYCWHGEQHHCLYPWYSAACGADEFQGKGGL